MQMIGLEILKCKNGYLVITPNPVNPNKELYETVFNAAVNAQQDSALSGILDKDSDNDNSNQIASNLVENQNYHVFKTFKEVLDFLNFAYGE